MKKFRLILSVLFILPLIFVSVVSADEHDEDADTPPIGFWEECETPQNLPDELTIGAIFGLSEAVAVYGIAQRQAVELAVAEVNAWGYLGEGVTLRVQFEDSAGNAQQAIAAMEKLVVEDGVLAVLGPTLSTEAFAADPIAQENGTVVMGVSNTAIGITDMGDFVFRNSLPEEAVIPGTVEQAIDALGLERVGVMYGDDDDFTISGFDVFVDALDDNEIEILSVETFARGDRDFSSQLTSLIARNPDALVVSALAAEAVQIIIQAREFGYDGPIIGGNGFNSPAVLDQSGEDAEGVIVGAAWNIGDPDPEPSSEAFQQAFVEEYGVAPDQFAAQAYTGAWLFATAIRCADSDDRADIRDALAAIEDFPSPLGLYSFDENRDPVHDPIAQIVFEGAFLPLASVIEGAAESDE
ncbi:MAG: ABC transporter substrate-binding protein [Anaerolineaceae bacterium]|nr:MAG: ABC transporter substrate-binding protein [Anaerolineaceae bacterium]